MNKLQEIYQNKYHQVTGYRTRTTRVNTIGYHHRFELYHSIFCQISYFNVKLWRGITGSAGSSLDNRKYPGSEEPHESEETSLPGGRSWRGPAQLRKKGGRKVFGHDR